MKKHWYEYNTYEEQKENFIYEAYEGLSGWFHNCKSEDKVLCDRLIGKWLDRKTGTGTYKDFYSYELLERILIYVFDSTPNNYEHMGVMFTILDLVYDGNLSEEE